MTSRNYHVDRVLTGGYCVGCGVCAAVACRPIAMQLDSNGNLIADLFSLTDNERSRVDAVCPFLDNTNETEIGTKLFSTNPDARYDEIIGWAQGLYSGYSIDDRTRGSSGGIATWLFKKLLNEGVIDYAIHVSNTPTDQTFFGYVVSSTTDQVEGGATSFYYPVQLRDVLTFIRNTPGRYAVSAVPCFSKALRLLMEHEPIFNERIVHIIGIVCGQLKSTWYLDYLCRTAGVSGELNQACFRRKQPERRADDYLFEAQYIDSEQQPAIAAISNRAIGANWGMGLFKPKACDFCDDVFAETADIAVMDAWLPKFIDDWRGTSLIVVRDPSLNQLLDRANDAGEIALEIATNDDLVASQQGGLNHRRAGLRYRLHLARKSWVPKKRVAASREFHWSFKVDQLTRLFIRRVGFTAMRIQRYAGPGIAVFSVLMKAPIFMFKLATRLKAKYQSTIYDEGRERNYRLHGTTKPTSSIRVKS